MLKQGLAVFGVVLVIATGAFLSMSGMTKADAAREVTISFVGDIMLSRGVQECLDQYGYDYPYEDVKDIFLADDLTVGNLECPITDQGRAVHKTTRFIFRGDEENAAALKRAGFDCLNLANNHTMDYLSEGLADTMNHLSAYGLDFVGAGNNETEDMSYIFEKNGIRVGILAYSAFPPEGFFYHAGKPTVRYISTANLPVLKEDIKALGNCDLVIVYFHWGIEYQTYNSEMQEQLAQAAIDAGAGFVIGAHPHVVQNTGVYQEVPIYYSLGNFVFDRQIPPHTDESVILQVTVGRGGEYSVKEIPVIIQSGKPVTMGLD